MEQSFGTVTSANWKIENVALIDDDESNWLKGQRQKMIRPKVDSVLPCQKQNPAQCLSP
jgi:hypothetical protein